MSTQYRIPSNDNYIRDLENISQRERHGLFNQPPPLLLGDQYNDAIKSKGKEKGILVNKKLQKKHEPSLFQEPGYTTLNDPYKDQFKAKQIYDKERELAIKNPNCFKPNDQIKSIKHSEFEHMKEFNDKIYNTRTPTGNVRTQARNFLTNPAKKGLGRTTSNNLFEQIEYIPDPYDRQEELERLERIKHKNKFLPGATRFITTSHGNRPFTADGILLDGTGYLSSEQNQLSIKKKRKDLFTKVLHLDLLIKIKKDFKEHLKCFNIWKKVHQILRQNKILFNNQVQHKHMRNLGDQIQMELLLVHVQVFHNNQEIEVLDQIKKGDNNKEHNK